MTLWSLLLVHFAALAVPGVDNFVVSQTAAAKGRVAGFWVGLGVTFAVLLWASLTVAGLSYVMAIPAVHLVITLFGAGYLLWLSGQLWRSARSTTAAAEPLPTTVSAKTTSRRGLMLKGLVTNLSNPKAVIYFSSIFAVFLTGGLALSARALMVGAIVVESFLWFWWLSRLFALPGITRAYQRWRVVSEYGAALLFAGFAGYMLWTLVNLW